MVSHRFPHIYNRHFPWYGCLFGGGESSSYQDHHGDEDTCCDKQGSRLPEGEALEGLRFVKKGRYSSSKPYFIEREGSKIG
jgi:hypothetical protein